MPCRELAPGNRLACDDGTTVAVEEIVDTGAWTTVFNIRVADHHTYFVGTPEWGFSAWAHNTCVTPAMREKILYGERKANPTSPGGWSNEVIGGHSAKIMGDPRFEVEVISHNRDGTTTVRYTKQLTSPDAVSQLSKSTLAPSTWSDDKIIQVTELVSEMPVVDTRTRDGATLHRATIEGVQWEVVRPC